MKKILPYLTLVVLFLGCNKEPKPDFSFIPGEWEFETIRVTCIINQYGSAQTNHYHIIDTIYYSGIIKNGVRPQDFTIYYTDCDSINVYYNPAHWAHGGYDPNMWRLWRKGDLPHLYINRPIGHFMDKNSIEMEIPREKVEIPECEGMHIRYDEVLGRKKK